MKNNILFASELAIAMEFLNVVWMIYAIAMKSVQSMNTVDSNIMISVSETGWQRVP